jgi:hypothetical protein
MVLADHDALVATRDSQRRLSSQNLHLLHSIEIVRVQP